MSTHEDEHPPPGATGAGARPTAADVPATRPDGTPVVVRAVLHYAAPGLYVAGAGGADARARVARRVRGALEGAGYVWPLRRVLVGALELEPADELEPGPARRHRATGDPAGGWSTWWPGLELPAAVAVAVAAGQLAPADVPAGPMVGELHTDRVLLAAGCRRVEPRRRVAWTVAGRGLHEWDLGTAQLLAADAAAARARAVRVAGLAAMRDAGMTLAAIAAATGLAEDRVRELVRESRS